MRPPPSDNATFEIANDSRLVSLPRCLRVFRAVHYEEHRVAACKVVTLTPETKPYDRKMIEKEIQVHSALKHANVLEFINAIIVEAGAKSRYHPGIYMLLELAAGGDLFDKIGMLLSPHLFVTCG